MKKLTMIIIVMSLGLMAWRTNANGTAINRNIKSVEQVGYYAIEDTVRTKDVKIKVSASPSAIAKVQLLKVQSLDGEVLFEKFAADNVSTVLRLKVTPATNKLTVVYGEKTTELVLENGVGLFDFTTALE